MKEAIKTTHYRVVVKEYDDGSIIEYRFPVGKRAWERRIIRKPDSSRKKKPADTDLPTRTSDS